MNKTTFLLFLLLGIPYVALAMMPELEGVPGYQMPAGLPGVVLEDFDGMPQIDTFDSSYEIAGKMIEMHCQQNPDIPLPRGNRFRHILAQKMQEQPSVVAKKGLADLLSDDGAVERLKLLVSASTVLTQVQDERIEESGKTIKKQKGTIGKQKWGLGGLTLSNIITTVGALSGLGLYIYKEVRGCK